MVSRMNRLRGNMVEPSFEEEEDDETQEQTQPINVENVVEEQFANEISDTCGNPASTLVLQPDGLWFDAISVVQVITDAIQSYYHEPCTCWKKASAIAKGQWWRFFREKFKWHERDSHAVKAQFNKKGGSRLKDMVNKADKVPIHKTVFWMSTQIRQQLKKVKSTPEFKKKSEQYLHNRMAGPKSGTKHCQGSKSSMQVAKKMMKDKGKMPTIAELFVITHQRPKDNSFCDPRAAKLNDDYEAEVVAAEENGEISNSSKNDIFVKNSGGFLRQGNLYGAGNSVSLFFDRSSGSSKNLRQATPSVVSVLEEQLTSTTQQLTSTTQRLASTTQQLTSTTKELEDTKRQLAEEKKRTDGHGNELASQKKLIEGLYDLMRTRDPSLFQSQQA